jgi:hypothetical protein
LTGFADQDHDDFINTGKFLCELEVIGGFFHGEKHTIEMKPCDESNKNGFSPAKPEDSGPIT